MIMLGGGYRHESSCGLAILMAALASASAADDPTTAEKFQTQRPRTREIAAIEAHVDDGALAFAGTPTLSPITYEAVFDNYVVFPDGTTAHQFRPPALAASERVIYNDTLGKVVASMPANQLIADDIATTAPNGCALTRFTFQTMGRANPSLAGGAYSISYALYVFCPGSVTQANRPSLIIPNTSGTVAFPDDGFHTVTVVLPPNTPIPTDFHLGISANRGNVGVIMGAPPLVGLSCDVFDHPSLACGTTFGGFPDQPYASFNAEFFTTDTCPATFVGYRNDNPKQSTFNPGAFKLLADDIHLNTGSCQMISYEVMVKGQGFYSFDLRGSCAGGTIPGTSRDAQVNVNNSNPQKLHFDFDPPISLPGDFIWFTAVVNNSTAGVVMTGSTACTGFTDDFLGILDIGACTIFSPVDTIQEALDVTITCQGTPPLGACCDMFVLDDQGEAVCRQVPEMNCPYPPRGSIQLPHWMPGAACDPSPFPQPCGLSACCAVYEKPDPSNPNQTTFVEQCENRTQTQCNAQHPITPQYPDGAKSLWQRGLYCAQQGQRCPRIACLERRGDCTTPQPTVGCNDAFCCDCVCQSFGSLGSYCCDVEWDEICVELIYAPTCGGCGHLEPSWDVCSSDHPGVGAHLINVPGTFSANMTNTTNDESDPQFCCHNGFQPACIGGFLNGFDCETADDCCAVECGICTNFHCMSGPNDQGNCGDIGDCCSNVCGVCPGRVPGAQDGVGSGWFKFAVPANQTSVLISTCRSGGPASDSLVQVFDCTDRTDEETCCGTLRPIGCNDDAAECGYTDTNSSLCVDGLTPGRTYYVMLAAKTEASKFNATYIVDVYSPCQTQNQVANDFCVNATNVTEGTMPFNLANAKPDCPLESCLSSMVNDIWYNYTTTCNGKVVIQTCGADVNTSPNTGLAVYAGCAVCPPDLPDPLACNESGTCGFGSKVNLDNVQSGQCFKVRLTDDLGNPVSGNLKIECGAPCPSGSISADTPPNNVVDARRPFDPDNPSFLQGIKQIKLFGPSDGSKDCFSVCETANGGINNGIINVQTSPGAYTVNLGRAIWPGALAKITYTPTVGAPTKTTYISHPGNVNGDTTTNSADISALVARLGGAPTPFGIFTEDIDRSGTLTPLDILDEVDLLNGAAQYAVWNGTTKATPNASCP